MESTPQAVDIWDLGDDNMYPDPEPMYEDDDPELAHLIQH